MKKLPCIRMFQAHTPLKLLEEVSNRFSLEPAQMSAKVLISYFR